MVLGNRSLSSALIDTWTDAYWRWPLIERLPTAEVAVVAALAVIVVVAAVVAVIVYSCSSSGTTCSTFLLLLNDYTATRL